jgi:hypothetical protein
MVLGVGFPIFAMVTWPALTVQASSDKWPAHFEVQARPNNKGTTGEGRLFIPVWQNTNNLLFMDMRGIGNSNHDTEGNFGLAYRALINDSWILGGHGFFDFRNSDDTNNRFYSATTGIELLSNDWDVRMNGYIPISGRKRVSSRDLGVVNDGIVVIKSGYETAFGGLDGEVGVRVPFPENSFLWDTRVFAGGYWFDAPSGFGDDIAGPRGRVEMRIHDLPVLPAGSRLTIGGDIQWDDPRGVQGGGLVSLRVPLYGYGGTPPNGDTARSRLSRRMTDPIVRDIDIVARQGRRGSDNAYNPKTGNMLGPVRYAESEGDGPGTYKDPDTIDGAIASAGEDGVVVVLDRTGPIDVGIDDDDTLAILIDGQFLLGGGASAMVARSDGSLVPFIAKGKAGTLFRDDYVAMEEELPWVYPVVIAARDNTISGLNFEGGGTQIFAPDPNQLMVMDSHFNNYARYGVLAGFPDGESFQFMSMNNRFHFTGEFEGAELGEGKATGIHLFPPFNEEEQQQIDFVSDGDQFTGGIGIGVGKTEFFEPPEGDGKALVNATVRNGRFDTVAAFFGFTGDLNLDFLNNEVGRDVNEDIGIGVVTFSGEGTINVAGNKMRNVEGGVLAFGFGKDYFEVSVTDNEILGQGSGGESKAVVAGAIETEEFVFSAIGNRIGDSKNGIQVGVGEEDDIQNATVTITDNHLTGDGFPEGHGILIELDAVNSDISILRNNIRNFDHRAVEVIVDGDSSDLTLSGNHIIGNGSGTGVDVEGLNAPINLFSGDCTSLGDNTISGHPSTHDLLNTDGTLCVNGAEVEEP